MNIWKEKSFEEQFELCKSILATLPLAYYTTRAKDSKYELFNDSAVFMNTVDDSIHIGFQVIKKAADFVEEIKTEWELEQIIRGLFYHEVSHIFLTPHCDLSYYGYHTIYNIFEDERIETLLEKYYVGVNFKKNIYLVNNLNPKSKLEESCPEQVFYNVVRFRKGKKEYVDEVYRIIKKYESLNATTEKYDGCTDYINEIIELFRKICEDMGYGASYTSSSEKCKPSESTTIEIGDGEDKDEEEPIEIEDGKESKSKSSSTKSSTPCKGDKETESESGDSEDKGEGEKGESKSKSESESKEDKGEDKDEEEPEIDYTEHESEKPDYKIAEESMHKNANIPDMKMEMELNSIIKKANAKKGMYGKARKATSGKLNPKALLKYDEKFRYFKKRCPMGSIASGNSKININCFIDVSASFCNDIHYVNRLLAILCRIEKQNPNLTVNVVACGNGEEQVFGDKRYNLIASGGNAFNEEIWPIMQKICTPSTRNYNLVLFDGDAWSMYCVKGRGKSKAEMKKNARAFAKPNTVVISDYSNQPTFDKYVKGQMGARCIYTHSYVETLEKEIMNVLAQLFSC